MSYDPDDRIPWETLLFRVVLLAGVAALVLYATGVYSDHGDLKAELALAERQRDAAVAELRVAQTRTDTITERVITRDWRLTAERDSLIRVLRHADSVRTDSTATMEDLRGTIGVLGGAAIRFEAEAMAYRDSVRTLIMMHAVERQATANVLRESEETIAAWERAVEAERRKGWRRFAQGAIVGGVVVLVLSYGALMTAVP